MALWNVRTMLDNETGPERRSALISKELEAYMDGRRTVVHISRTRVEESRRSNNDTVFRTTLNFLATAVDAAAAKRRT